MIGQRASLLAAIAVAGMLSGCADAPPGPPPAASAAPSPHPASDVAACADADITVSTVRGIADALQHGPVLPAGVELLLSGPREKTSTPEDAGPELTAARAEMVAAIDDLDAQADSKLPSGGNAARDPVQLNPDRILAAAAELERLCGTARPSPG